MKDVFLLYDSCCIYEIAPLNLFMKLCGRDVVFCSPDGGAVLSREGYSVNTDCALADIDISCVSSFIVPGGAVENIDSDALRGMLCALNSRGALVAGICAGVDMLDGAGLLKNIRSTHSTDEDCVCDGSVVTARANAYTDFAIEIAGKLNMFADEADLQETIDFRKYRKIIQ